MQTPLPPFDELPRRWFRFCPPRHPCGGISQPILRLHTVQSRTAYELLRSDGILQGDLRYADPYFHEAYRWMARQMADRLPTSGPGIVWLWARTERRDLVTQARYARGDVLLEVRIPRERVLLSPDDDWLSVASQCLHVPRLPGESTEDWSVRFDQIWDDWLTRTCEYHQRPIEQWPTELRAELETSWEVLFDPWSVSSARYLQATIHALYADDVVHAAQII